ALSGRREQCDQDDRRQTRARGQPLAVAEPEDQEGNDDRAPADPEEAAEGAGGGADPSELQQAVTWHRSRARHWAAILDGMTTASRSASLDSLIAPLREDPAAAAVLTDIAGTLAPIVERPELAAVPTDASAALAQLTGSYGLVGCVSGR